MPRSGIELTTSRLHNFIMAKVSHALNHSAMEAWQEALQSSVTNWPAAGNSSTVVHTHTHTHTRTHWLLRKQNNRHRNGIGGENDGDLRDTKSTQFYTPVGVTVRKEIPIIRAIYNEQNCYKKITVYPSRHNMILISST